MANRDLVNIFLFLERSGWFLFKKVKSSRLIFMLPTEEDLISIALLGRADAPVGSASKSYYSVVLHRSPLVPGVTEVLAKKLPSKTLKLVDQFPVLVTSRDLKHDYVVEGFSVLVTSRKFSLIERPDISDSSKGIELVVLRTSLDVSSIDISSKLQVNVFANKAYSLYSPIVKRILYH